MDDVIALTRKKFNEITEESWKEKCEKSMKYESVKQIPLIEEAVESCIIQLGGESSEEEEVSSDSDGDLSGVEEIPLE